jgi:uncharacterized protein (DUF1810 family)
MSDTGLERFVKAQEHSYATALSEVKSGRKRSHWIWYIFPQLKGLGFSDTAAFYGIADLSEAKDYLAHPVLGERLREISETALLLETDDALEVFGYLDNLKLCSSMTLFALADGNGDSVFRKVLDKYFHGAMDEKTFELLNRQLD